jgi:hypothetical protein
MQPFVKFASIKKVKRLNTYTYEKHIDAKHHRIVIF